jgi:serine/threonine-protein kinase
LLSGDHAADQSDLISHLDRCESCQQMLDRLAGADPALLDVARTLQKRTFVGESALRQILDDLGNDASLSDPLGRTIWGETLLDPAKSLEALGPLEDYRVTQVLGRGSTGIVFKAFEPRLKRWVAIKVLSPTLSGEQVARLRFAREAQSAARVRHKNVITIHAVSEANGIPYFVMEYIEGGSLQDWLDAHPPPDWQVVARLGFEIASGLAAAHTLALVHRDIKPSNILLQPHDPADELGSVKISDFGLACAADESRLTRTGLLAGTPMYMAPEQARGEQIDHRSDLFSLGSVLYALCTGAEPFRGGSPVAVLHQVCDDTPQPIRELNPKIPAWLAATVERLHAKRPDDRFGSAAEVAELLNYNLHHPDRPRQVALARRSG